MFPSKLIPPEMFSCRRTCLFTVVLSCVLLAGFSSVRAAEQPAAATPREALPPEASSPGALPPAAAPSDATPPNVPSNAETEKEPRLRFNFRFQAWVDVLEWFARQADLSLVLDTPVPGTFNYTDNKEYTPTEAIDLLNGVLLTKGHTLIRRGRMLMVVNLQDGMPQGMAPRVSAEDLNKRGRFEFVSVLLPLGRRNVEEMNKEIAPLLGPYGKSVPLPKTSQLLVTDTAGILQAIDAMIKSMPEPEEKKPAEEPKADKKKQSEPPTLAVYPLGTADADVAVKVLKTLLPDDKIVLDPRAGQINVYAAPVRQAVVKSVLERMRAAGPGGAVQIEVHRLKTVEPEAALAVLEKLLPDAHFAVDAKSRGLVAVALPAEQAAIRAALAELQGAAGEPAQLLFYPLEQPPPAGLIEGLKELAPRAKIILEAGGKRLIMVADANDHAQVAAALARMSENLPDDRKPRFAGYQIVNADPVKLFAMLQTFFRNQPEIQLTLDDANETIMVLATPRDHEKIRSLIEEVEQGGSPRTASKVEVYSLKNVDSRALEEVLKKLLEKDMAKVQLSFDSRSDQLVAIAGAEQQDVIRQTIDRMRTEPQELEIFQLNVVDPSTAVLAINRLFGTSGYGYNPTAPVVDVDEDSQQLFVSANKEQHKKIRELLVKMGETNLKTVDETQRRSPAPGDAYDRNMDRNMDVFVLKNTDALQVARQLQDALQEMRPRWERYQNRVMIVADERLNAIIVKANRSDRAMVESMVRILDSPQTPESAEAGRATLINIKNTEAFRVERVVNDVFRAQLAESARRGPQGGSSRWSPRVTVDAASNSLVVVAAPALLAQIEELVRTLDAAAADDSARGLKIISLKKANASRVEKALDAAIERAVHRRGRQ